MATQVIAEERRERHRIAWLEPAAVGVILSVLYVPVLRDLVAIWSSVSYYSYGFLIPAWSAWLALGSRSRVAAIPAHRDVSGLILVAAGLGALAFANAHGSLTVAALSLPVVLTGLGRFALGREAFRPLAFPVGFLALMAPLPPSTLPTLSLVLQQLAAWFTEVVLEGMGIPVVREGLFLHLRSATVHVAEECNGLRFLLAMVVLGVAFAWAVGRPRWRLLVFTVALGAAIAANLVRVSGTAVLVHFWGPGVAIGLPHHSFGKAIYLATLALVVLLVLRLRARQGEAPQ